MSAKKTYQYKICSGYVFTHEYSGRTRSQAVSIDQISRVMLQDLSHGAPGSLHLIVCTKDGAKVDFGNFGYLDEVETLTDILDQFLRGLQTNRGEIVIEF